MRSWPVLPIALLALALLAAACGGNGDEPAPTSTATAPAPTPTAMAATPTSTAVSAPTPTTGAPEPTATPPSLPTATAPQPPPPTATAPQPPPPTATPTIPPFPTIPGPGIVNLGPSKDNTLYESESGSLSNGSGSHFFVGNTGNGSTRRAVIAFDIAGSIPPGSTIESVTLTLSMSRTTSGSEPVELHKLLADWGEGTSTASANEGGGTSARSGDATWVHRMFDTATWQTPGGDFAPAVSASTAVAFIDNYAWRSTAQMVADVQGWVDDPSSNFGWLLQGNETRTRTSKRFDSRENSTEANRPVLTVQFTPPS